jgi:antitoxin component YwqK of YwqJK toxin-antitoxin module
MKTTYNIFFLGLMISAGAFAQEGELVSIDAETKRAYYTRNDDYKVESDGSFTGNIVAYYESGTTEETGALKSGVKDGVWIKYNEAGQRTHKGYFKNGVKHGEWKVWDDEGNLRIEFGFENGKRIGEWIFYDENGNVSQTRHY